MVWTPSAGYWYTNGPQAPQQTGPLGNIAGGATSSVDPRSSLMQTAGQAGAFGSTAAGNYNDMTEEGRATRDYLGRLMRGQDSVSAEQLRQALQQNLAAQRSFASSASPQNAAMAARTAATGMGRAASGLAGQQALAGIAERNAAATALGGMQTAFRGQDVSAALGGQGNAIQGYQGAIKPPEPSWWERGIGALTGLGGAALSNPKLFSDKRLKTEIEDGDKDSTRLLEGLKAYTYRYKNERHGKGRQLGVMAQDLQKVAPQAVVDTEEGKAVDAGKLAGALAAALPTMHARIKKLEGRK